MDAQDLIEIHQLISLYGHAMDSEDSDLIPEVFSDDAVVDESQFGLDLTVGIDAIKAWHALGRGVHPPSHQTTNVYVYERDGETRVKSKFHVFRPSDCHPILGDYDDVVIKTGRGWRIKRRGMTMRFPSPSPQNFHPAEK